MQRPQTSRRTATRGFTLIELALSMTILGSLLAALGWFQVRSQALYRQTAVRAELEEKARQATTRVLAELTGVGTSMLAPDPTSSFGSDSIAYQKPVAVSNAGVVTWSSPSRLELQDEEANDGVDNDGDGLVDEQNLVLVRNVGMAGQVTTVILRGVPELAPGEFANGVDDDLNGLVDEAGFNVQRTGDLLRVRVTVVRSLGDGITVDASMSTALVLRN